MPTLRYITLSELKNQIPNRLQGILANDTPGDDSNTEDSISDIILQNALAAEATFESYIARRYDLPVAAGDGTVSELIKSHIFTIAKYKLYARRDALTPAIQTQYSDTIQWLNDVARGRANIVILDSTGDVEDEGNEPTVVVGPADSGSLTTSFERMP